MSTALPACTVARTMQHTYFISFVAGPRVNRPRSVSTPQGPRPRHTFKQVRHSHLAYLEFLFYPPQHHRHCGAGECLSDARARPHIPQAQGMESSPKTPSLTTAFTMYSTHTALAAMPMPSSAVCGMGGNWGQFVTPSSPISRYRP
jgi:hypothetical protein